MPLPTLGVVVVTYTAHDVILDCLESLLAARDVALDIVVVDNASPDDTVGAVRAWAAGTQAYTSPAAMPFTLIPCHKPVALHPDGHPRIPHEVHHITLVETGVNGGFAFGVNRGLEVLAARPHIDRFWVLNPDTAVPPETPAAFATAPAPEGDFALMGGRTVYFDTPDVIQIDGGTINRRTGITGNIHLGQSHRQTGAPDVTALDFITGSNVVASRAFYETAGPMPEEYFLYYEEVDWALRRGDLPLMHLSKGHSVSSGGERNRIPHSEPPRLALFALFSAPVAVETDAAAFPDTLLSAQAYSLAKATQLMLKGYCAEAGALLAGSFGCPPPRQVRAALSDDAAARAFGTDPTR